MNTEECLICGAPLEYLTRDEDMECAICHRWEPSKTRCAQGPVSYTHLTLPTT